MKRVYYKGAFEKMSTYFCIANKQLAIILTTSASGRKGFSYLIGCYIPYFIISALKRAVSAYQRIDCTLCVVCMKFDKEKWEK